MGRLLAHRGTGAQVALACVAAGAVAGCGSGPRQDADEPKGNFPVQVVDASFPAMQSLARTSNMVITVRNPGPKTIPVVSVTVKCPGQTKGGSGGSASNTGGGAGGFSYRTTQPNVADPTRPRFVVNTVPTRTPRNFDHGRLDPLERSSAYVDTYPLGSLAAGRSITFRWNVTAVKPGPFRVCYRVNAGLDGKAIAVPAQAGDPIDGEFVGEIQARAPQAHIGPDGKTVVESGAVSGTSP